ncbi:MAG: hypothetical protein LBO66_10045 [Deltaproteobacteria bacterium]|jgi:hypothetical protein|nr:hypothetical protein [Deltaproteobacteria bacterium]
MDQNLKSVELLLLWDLLSRGEGEFLLKLVSPRYSKQNRDSLKRLGLIAESQEKEVRDGKSAGRPKTWVKLTDKGWRYLEENMSAPIETRSPAVGAIMGRVLALLSQYMLQERVPISRVFGPPPPVPPFPVPPPPPDGDEPKDARTLLSLARAFPLEKRMDGGGIRLATLRQAYPRLARASLDHWLLELQSQGALVLYRFDDPTLVTPADEDAALRVNSNPRHYLALK